MNMPVSCSMFKLDYDLYADQLADELPNYRHANYHEDVDGDLLTTIDEVERTQRGIAATIRYDRPLRIGARPGENPWVKNTINARVRLLRTYSAQAFSPSVRRKNGHKPSHK